MTLKVRCSTVALLTLLFATTLMAQERTFLTNDRLTLGTGIHISASVRLGDVDNDSDLDVVVANGRHWPELTSSAVTLVRRTPYSSMTATASRSWELRSVIPPQQRMG